jgi:hypothetical protein
MTLQQLQNETIKQTISIKNDHFNFGMKEISVSANPRDADKYNGGCSELIILDYFTNYFNNKEFANKKLFVVFDPKYPTGGFSSNLSFCDRMDDCPQGCFVAMVCLTKIGCELILNIDYPKNVHEYYFIKFAKV